MSDLTRREREKRFIKTGDPRDEVVYLARVSTDGVFGQDHYQRAREIINEPSLEDEHRETLCVLVRKHDKENSFEELSDDDLVKAMPIINYFLDNGCSIYSTGLNDEHEGVRDIRLVIMGDFNQEMGDADGEYDWRQYSIVPGDETELVSGLTKCLEIKLIREVGTYCSSVSHKTRELDKGYQTSICLLEYGGQPFDVRFLDNQIRLSINALDIEGDDEYGLLSGGFPDLRDEDLDNAPNFQINDDLDQFSWEIESHDDEEENTDEDLFF